MTVFKSTTRRILSGGILFLIPLTILVLIFGKFYAMIQPLAEKLGGFFGEHVFLGITTVSVTGFIIILLLAYLSGWLVQLGLLNFWGPRMEETLFRVFPSMQMFKYRLLPDEEIEKLLWRAILLPEDKHYRIAFITDDSQPDHLSIFVPDAPRMDAGEVRLMKKSEFKGIEISMKDAMNALFHFGRGMKL
ncbi:hypothetical protein [Fulvivirga sedimenti]|uniref:DUF502 domain-containing protein n=1 Tax=Fulvivirga sedimenti TaxID=2879465 RepID=A0A9X1KW00_9BACT|nr:hypothetical protein [Fulvivirga sedimenti]MCA6073459.1 hypothetical protein [Fulvivirga sedimenti]